MRTGSKNPQTTNPQLTKTKKNRNCKKFLKRPTNSTCRSKRINENNQTENLARLFTNDIDSKDTAEIKKRCNQRATASTYAKIWKKCIKPTNWCFSAKLKYINWKREYKDIYYNRLAGRRESCFENSTDSTNWQESRKLVFEIILSMASKDASLWCL